MGSPPEKGRNIYIYINLVLTLGSPPEKGGKKKTLGRPSDLDFKT
jgi:hypothetical protein